MIDWKTIENLNYSGKRRVIIHCTFWIFWFLFVWNYEKNNFWEGKNLPSLDLALAIRDIIVIILTFYIASYFIFKKVAHGKIVIPLITVVILYFFFYASTYHSMIYLNHIFENNTFKIYSTQYTKYGFWSGLIQRRTFWFITFWYSLTMFVPLVIKLFIDISTFRIKNINLEKDNIRLELDYLKSQVNPHFLFNVLNSIYSIVIDSEPRAAQIVLKLSDLMRYSLYEASNDRVPLQKEIQFIRDYVELEKIRHKKSTRINFHVEGNPDGLQVPPFLLITFVENAFKHGVSSTIKSSWVEINLSIQNGVLEFKVENSKPEKLKQDNTQGGIGLWNVRKRLDLLFPNKYQLSIENNASTYQVQLSIQLT